MGRRRFELDDQRLLEDVQQMAMALGDVLRVGDLEGRGERAVPDAREAREQLVEGMTSFPESRDDRGRRARAARARSRAIRARRGSRDAPDEGHGGEGAERLQEAATLEGIARLRFQVRLAVRIHGASRPAPSRPGRLDFNRPGRARDVDPLECAGANPRARSTNQETLTWWDTRPSAPTI
jgi:hypothetical protein